MSNVVIVGGGVSGLGTALFLTRRGHDVTIIERDRTPMPATAAEAFEWDRRGAPQVRHSHALLGRLRKLLVDHHPDVLEALLDEGATEIRMANRKPATLDDQSPRDGDDDLVMLASRRTTFEWVMRRIVTEEGLAKLKTGSGVTGLVTDRDIGMDRSSAGVPRVTGVTLEDATVVKADIVIAAHGRRSDVPNWLEAIGTQPLVETIEDTGIAYYSRFYELGPGQNFPSGDRLIGGDLTYLKYGVFWGDNATFSVTLATADDDRTLRALKDGELFDQVARSLPATADWLNAGAAPITKVHSMAGLLNRRRDYLSNGQPIVLGFHAVGDAHIATNPMHGRGCSTGMWQGLLVADAIDAHPDDPAEQSRAFCAAVDEHIAPWYAASVTSDRSSRRAIERSRAEAAGEDVPELDAADFMSSVIREGLSPASRSDAVVWQSFMRMINLLDPPESLMAPDVANRIFAVWQDRENRPTPEPLGPERDELLSLLGLTDNP
jgi:2-polyprenyl-6-methoxyphenol hydroxylase-like FAD-dependent oxidoreductase